MPSDLRCPCAMRMLLCYIAPREQPNAASQPNAARRLGTRAAVAMPQRVALVALVVELGLGICPKVRRLAMMIGIVL